MKGPQCHNFCQKTNKLSNHCPVIVLYLRQLVIKCGVKRKKSTNSRNESFRSDNKHTQRKVITEGYDTTNHIEKTAMLKLKPNY